MDHKSEFQGIKLNSTLTIDNLIVRNHLVNGQALLPGLAYIDMLFQIVKAYGLDIHKTALKNVTIFKPLIVREGMSVDLTVTFSGHQDHWNVLIEGIEREINGDMTSERKKYMTAELHAENSVRFDETIDIEEIKRTAKRKISLEDGVYSTARKKGMLHRGIIKADGEIYITEDGGVISLSVPEEYCLDADGYLFHPALLDGGGMASGLIIQGIFPAQDNQLFLPIFYEYFSAAELIQTRCYSRVQVSSIDLSNDIIRFDIEFFNENGKQAGVLKRLTSKLVRSKEQASPGGVSGYKELSWAAAVNPVYEDAEQRPDGGYGESVLEEKLTAVFGKHLNVKPEQIDAKLGFFDLGLESAQLLDVLKELEELFDTILNPTLLFEYSSISELVNYFEKKGLLKGSVTQDRVYRFHYNEPYLQDHLVFGRPALMGVTHASCIIEEYFRKNQGLKGVRLSRLQFFGGPVTPEENGVINVRVQFEDNNGAKGFKSEYYLDGCPETKLCMTGQSIEPLEDPQEYVDMQAMLKQGKPLDAYKVESIYNVVQDFGIGEMLKIIKEAYVVDETTLITRVCLSGKAAKGNCDSFVFDPLLLSGCYFHYNQGDKKDHLFIPLMIESLKMYCRPTETNYIITKVNKVKSDFMSFNSFIVNETGYISAEIINASVKEVQNPYKLKNATFPQGKDDTVRISKKLSQPYPQEMDIAIVGVAGRYPQAESIKEFWNNIRDGKDCITEIPKDRWEHELFFNEDKNSVGTTYSKWGGFLDHVDCFDPLFFNISPRDAEIIDPQERLFLECAYETLEDAGYTREGLAAKDGSEPEARVGVFVGVMYEEYQLYGAQETALGRPVALSGSPSSVANRVSYFCNFHGPSMAVDTMCSSSLTAIHLACQSIRRGECEAALAGGVNVSIHPNKYLFLAQGKFASSKGRCESFGQGGDGYVPSEGVGAVFLKPLRKAIEDRDHIYCVIKSTSINHGGKTSGFTVPNPKYQAKVIKQVFEEAGIDPRTVSYIEAHGTGTSLGDPIEIAGLTKAFREYTDDRQFCAIGSVKSNIGHAESAAGIAGITKVLLQMKYRQLAPTLHSKVLNPNIDFSDSPFTVQQELADWIPTGTGGQEIPRRAGISSFGAGGSNAHILVEEYTAKKAKEQEVLPSAHKPPIFVLSAKNEDRLMEQVKRLINAIQEEKFSDSDLVDIAYTLQIGREAMEERLAVIAASISELEEKLTEFAEGRVNIPGLFRGQVKRNKEVLAAFVADDDMEKTVDAWIAKGKYAKVSDVWVKGIGVDWKKLYNKALPCRKSLPAYPFARERYWVPETESTAPVGRLKAEPAFPTPVSKAYSHKTEIHFLKKEWTLCPAASEVKQEGKVAILATEETRGLALQLSEYFPKCEILDADDSVLHTRKNKEDWEEYTGLIDITGCGSKKSESLEWIEWVQQFIEYGQRGRMLLLCVTKGLEAFQNTCINLSGAFRAGLYRMLQCEYGYLRSRHMDLEGAVADNTAAEQIYSEFLTESDDAEVCYRNGERFYSYLGDMKRQGENRRKISFNEGQVLLITGGTRGLGFLCARHFISNYGVKRLVLTGREEIPPREMWDSLRQQDTSVGKKIRDIEALETEGVQVRTISVSLSDKKAFQQSMDEIRSTMGPVGGVIHCAGLGDMENPAFIRKSAGGVRRVMEPKVTGLDTLYETVGSEPLEFFILFSSVSAAIPALAAGQSDYAMANAYMDYMAEACAKDCPVISIQWPSWKETGAGGAKSKVYEKTGLMCLLDSEGLEMLDIILSEKTGSVVMPVLVKPDEWKPSELMKRTNLAAVASNAGSRKSSVPCKPEKGDSLEAFARTWLVSLFSRELKVDEARMEVETQFSDYGMDSIMLAQILQKINKTLKEDLEPGVLLEYPTIGKFAGWLIKAHPGPLGEALNISTVEENTTPVEEPPLFLSEFTSSGKAWEPVPYAGNSDSRGNNTPEIAVVGISCRFPGADSLEEYWRLLSEGRTAIHPVPYERWGYSSNFYAGLLGSINFFDPEFFLIPEEDAAVMDPQALIVLEECLKLLYHAGYSHQSMRGRNVGVYLGARSNHRPEETGLDKARNPIVAAGQNYLSANVSQFFDFRGPSAVIDTACSSALVAMSMAIQALQCGDVETAIVGGVSLLNEDLAHRMFQRRGILGGSPEFHIFDQRAGGIIPGEGVGMVLIKTLEQAQKDGDQIYAVVKKIAVNNDGRTAGPATPNPQAQKDVMAAALSKSGRTPEEISYIEVNGSGVEVTDLLELKAIQSVYRLSCRNPLGLGSIKPNIGHPLCAEGIAGFIKVVLMLKHKKFVPFLSGERPIGHYDMEASPFNFCRKLADWIGTPRVAAVNCFADGGTNAHVILEEWDSRISRSFRRNPLPPPELNRIQLGKAGGKAKKIGAYGLAGNKILNGMIWESFD